MTTNKRHIPRWARIALIVAAILVVLASIAGYQVYRIFLKKNVTDQQEYLYIRTGWTFQDVLDELSNQDILKNVQTFKIAAEQMEYPGRVKAGKYKLESGMNNRTLINKLGGGFQEPVRIRFHNLRLKEELAAHIGHQIEADSAAIMALFADSTQIASLGFTPDNFFSMFLPDTYEFYWNTSASQFLDRMHREYQRYWNDDWLQKAQALDMTPQEVSILASIVQGEAMHDSEMPTIAGLYINRLRRGIKLQADPTVIYANQDFSIRRVLYKHLTYDSPYNTYLYAGLPPGPILLPSKAAIDAVLNHEEHNYIYMCAKEDFSGYHSFAVTLAEHNANARRFQRALNERNIMR